MKTRNRKICLIIILVSLCYFFGESNSDFKGMPILSFGKITRKLCIDSLESTVFGIPYDIEEAAFGEKRIMIATDPGMNRITYIISKIKSPYDSLESINEFGWGSLKAPHGITGSEADGIFFVADTYNSRVVRMRYENGQLVWDGVIGEGVLQKPYGVEYDGMRVYIADTHNSRIVSYRKDGTDSRTYGSYGQGEGQFAYPKALAKFGKYIYVLDTWNFRVVLLEEREDGTFMWKGSIRIAPFWDGGKSIAEVSLRDIDVDSHGFPYVTDGSNHRVVKLMSDISDTIKSYGGFGIEVGKFFYPNGLWMSPDTGKVIITEQWNENTGITAWRLTVKVYDAYVSPSTFYPVPDTAYCKIGFKVDEAPAKVMITIGNWDEGDPCKRWVRNTEVMCSTAGVEYSFIWDGKDDLGRLFPPNERWDVLLHPVDMYPGGTYESEDTTIIVGIKGKFKRKNLLKRD